MDALNVMDVMDVQAAKSMLNTAVCPSAAVVVTMLIHWLHHRRCNRTFS